MVERFIPVRVKEVSPELKAKYREQVGRIFEKMRTDPKIEKRYAELTAEKFREMVMVIQTLDMDCDQAFREIWAQHHGDTPCPDTETQARSAMVILNLVSVAAALMLMKDEVSGAFTQDAIEKLFEETMELPPSGERGN